MTRPVFLTKRTGLMVWSVWGCLVLGGLVPASTAAQTIGNRLPPAPALPELNVAACQEALENLTSDDYYQRKQASEMLQQGGLETVQRLPEFAKSSSPEGQVRALEAAQQIYLRLLRLQYDDEALQVREAIDQICAVDEALLRSRVDSFQAIHSSLMIRASVRAMVRLNAVLEFRVVKQTFPGISKQDFTGELPYHVFIGENWLGNEQDLRHVELLVLLGEQQFGSSRAIYRIDGCPIPMETFQDLVAGIPGVFLEQRSKARLGIGGGGDLYGDESKWKVTQISPGTAAAHAGLRINDIIVRLNNKLIGTFRDLTVDLEAYAPPDQVFLDIVRETVPQEAITFTAPADWEEFGLSFEEEYGRFPVVKEVKKGSEAEKLGLTPLHRLEMINGQTIVSPLSIKALDRALREEFKPGDPIEFTVRKMERVPVTLRGWVGPYR